MTASLRFPAEWEPQSAVLIAWPHAGTDWFDRLAGVEATYVALVKAITRFERVLVCVPDGKLAAHATSALAGVGVDLERVRFVPTPYNDTWLRDSGPITLRDGDGFRLLDFFFTAWGGKFVSDLDDKVVSTLYGQGIFRDARHLRIGFALEGGAIETDGAGTLLTTWRCLHERHSGKSREEITATLESSLAQDRTLWLERGYLEGDDTDAHIDTLARFAGPDAIVFQGCQDPGDAHFLELQAMAGELAAFRTGDDRPYRLFELPWAKPIVDDGRRLAASYANFLIVNGAVLMPAYGDDADARAAEVLAQAFPDREIVPVSCRALIWQNGSLHCLTMQLPEGLIA